MTAGVMQGIMTNTMDVDIWVDLPARQYIRLWNLIKSQGGTALSQTLYALSDGKVVNFLFSVTGLNEFSREFRHCLDRTLDGQAVKVLPLERILKSKETVRRDKDLPHIAMIRTLLKARRIAGGNT
jgi:hypothetical protein